MTKNSTFTVPKSPTGIYTIPVGVGGGGGTSMGDLNRTPPAWIDPSVLSHFIKDHEITGQTIFAEYILPPNYLGMTESEIKGLLIEKLMHELYKQKYIEFTQMKRVETDEMIYRARIHAVPDTQVRIIREIKDARKTT
jgi:hypothetical protein